MCPIDRLKYKLTLVYVNTLFRPVAGNTTPLEEIHATTEMRAFSQTEMVESVETRKQIQTWFSKRNDYYYSPT